MFNTPLAQVTYERVLDFCRTFPEGVRVEYKREPVNIPKVVSSFANTVGGIWIVGVDADKKTNRVVLPPVGVEGAGLEERIVQSTQSGIYPAITPAVRVFEVPEQAGRMLAVVKVAESIEAPHAIENSTRVWVRTASTTEPYELADIDRIEYLLKRRQEPERRREELIQRAAARSAYQGHVPRVCVIVSPVYPRGILLPHDELYERAEHLENLGNSHVRNFRTIHEAIATKRVGGDASHYFEVSVYGVVFYESPTLTARRFKDVPFVYLQELLYPVGNVLNTALVFLKDTLTNLMIRYELIGWQGTGYLSRETAHLVNPEQDAQTNRCIDRHITVSTQAIAETLVERRGEVLTDLMRTILWAFNYRADPDLPERVYGTLKGLNLT